MASFYRKNEIPEHLQRYFCPAEIGLEPTLAEYIAGMVAVFQEVRRVLKDDGVLWLNIGDSYAGGGGYAPNAPSNEWSRAGQRGRQGALKSGGIRPQGLVKSKDLMMIPASLAIALQDDGWWLRSDVIWHKPNPMPESVRDRPTSAHEHIFLLTKSGKYFYDADAIAEPAGGDPRGPGLHNGYAPPGQEPHRGSLNPGVKHRGSHKGSTFNHGKTAIHQLDRSSDKARVEHDTRNIRNVWSIATVGFPESHFATFPPEIPRRCILAGSREGDTVLDPFAGAGTTGLVADRLGRDAILIELSPKYADMARRRIYNDAPLFAEVESA